MRTGLLALSVIGLSILLLTGCASQKKLLAPCGANDYIEMEPGTVITGVTLPTDEVGKKYNIVTPKKGFWISMACDERIGR